MEKLTINRIYLSRTSGDGRPYFNEQVRVTLYFQGKDGGYSCLFPEEHPIVKAKQGDVVEVELEEKGKYKNFKLGNAGSRTVEVTQGTGKTQLDRIESKLNDLYDLITIDKEEEDVPIIIEG